MVFLYSIASKHIYSKITRGNYVACIQILNKQQSMKCVVALGLGLGLGTAKSEHDAGAATLNGVLLDGVGPHLRDRGRALN